MWGFFEQTDMRPALVAPVLCLPRGSRLRERSMLELLQHFLGGPFWEENVLLGVIIIKYRRLKIAENVAAMGPPRAASMSRF